MTTQTCRTSASSERSSTRPAQRRIRSTSRSARWRRSGPDGKAAALSGEARAAWLARAKKWVDLSPVLGVTRLMHNQGALTDDSKAGVISLWKELQDYATPKGIKISGETRGSGAPTPGVRPGRPQRPRPRPRRPCPRTERLRYVWGILWECTVGSGGYTNLDFGGETRFHDQQELHDAIKGLLPRNAGGMHTRVSPTWDLGTAISTPSRSGTRACTPSR